jgi:arylsulfatase A-like enzyme
MEYLERNGLKDNTIVILIGDNGAALLRGKGTLYEFGINVPLIVRWPGMVKPGSVSREVISMEDLAPTVMEAAGLNPKPDMTGISFLSILKGDPAPTRQYAFAERGPHADGLPSQVNNGFDQSRVIISKDYKLIYNCQPTLRYAPVDFSGMPFYREIVKMNEDGQLDEKYAKLYFYDIPRPLLEFYDLKKDPSETNNLIAEKAYFDIKEQMLKELILWMIRERDYLPLPRNLVGR